MPAPEIIDGKPILELQDEFAEVSVSAGATNEEVLKVKTYTGLKPYLLAYRQAWDSEIDDPANVQHLEINGVRRHPYTGVAVQLAPPEQDVWLPRPIPLEQNTNIRVAADNGTAVAGNHAARLIIGYVDPR